MHKLNSSSTLLGCYHFGERLLHVTDVLRTTPEENLNMIEDTVRYLKNRVKRSSMMRNTSLMGIQTIWYALSTLEAASRGGADF